LARGLKFDHITPEVREFLMTGTRTAKIATVRADGRPHMVPVWFLLDGGDIVFTTWHTTTKARNIRRYNRVCMSVDEERPLYSFVQIEGIATMDGDPDTLLLWATRIGGRYMGEDEAEFYEKRNSVPGELLVRVKPTQIIAEWDLAGWD